MFFIIPIFLYKYEYARTRRESHFYLKMHLNNFFTESKLKERKPRKFPLRKLPFKCFNVYYYTFTELTGITESLIKNSIQSGRQWKIIDKKKNLD